ncbi:hypothetical protein [Cytobacillus dafuensis]|uniref:Uncharacterized protein n=1 Tax=Cytobacillus dafuensis TaxID=1742359 RepID=A0A5B8Z165_CYTDA|nr:hypothetical protein [Cytobacillus dafuensis]QED46710.1 hypothetical protein FSZ17_05150 [Cytobacillus dafuensis]
MKKKKLQNRPEQGKFKQIQERFFIILVALCAVFFVLALLLWLASMMVKEQFILHEMINTYCGASISFCFAAAFLLIATSTRNIFGIIASLFFTIIFLSAGVHFINTSLLLHKDKEAYENQSFERIVGIPDQVEYDDPDVGPAYVLELVFKNKTIDAHNLQIHESFFESNLRGKQLEILYLPNSLYAVEVKEYVSD